MKVKLINFTSYAEDVLIFSKKTRLKMGVDSFSDVQMMTHEQKMEELKYVFGTIGSSWEFVDYIFLVEGVTRAFTHQLVRHRVGFSFAQQSQRTVNMDNFEYLASGDVDESAVYHGVMSEIKKGYGEMIKEGIHPQDARGVLPTNILTNILVKVNLRAFSALCNSRLCIRTQGEFQDVVKEMRKEVLRVHPWTRRILKVHCAHYGTCMFPKYQECPIKQKGLVAEPFKEEVENEWESLLFEAKPVQDTGVSDGKG